MKQMQYKNYIYTIFILNTLIIHSSNNLDLDEKKINSSIIEENNLEDNEIEENNLEDNEEITIISTKETENNMFIYRDSHQINMPIPVTNTIINKNLLAEVSPFSMITEVVETITNSIPYIKSFIQTFKCIFKNKYIFLILIFFTIVILSSLFGVWTIYDTCNKCNLHFNNISAAKNLDNGL